MNVLEKLTTELGQEPCFHHLYEELRKRRPFPCRKTDVPNEDEWLLFHAAVETSKRIPLEDLLLLAEKMHPTVGSLLVMSIQRGIDSPDHTREALGKHLCKG
jgi:hypothetical protein